MTAGRLLFVGVWTSWILLAIRLEGRDLVRTHGDAYRSYRRRVPMLLPIPGRSAAGTPRDPTMVEERAGMSPAE